MIFVVGITGGRNNQYKNICKNHNVKLRGRIVNCRTVIGLTGNLPNDTQKTCAAN